MNPLHFQPRDTNYLVELLEPAARTPGGIYLPETTQENWEDALILKAGPGFAGGAPWGEPGERIVFHQHDYRPFFTGSRQGVVADEAVICIIAGDKIYPANDWVLVELTPFVTTAGEVLLPEAVQQRDNCGVIRNWGPGRLQRQGPKAGCRRAVEQVLNVEAWELFDQRVWWTGPADAYEIGSDTVQGVLVRATDLLFLDA